MNKPYYGKEGASDLMRKIIEQLQKERAEKEQKKWEQESIKQYERQEQLK